MRARMEGNTGITSNFNFFFTPTRGIPTSSFDNFKLYVENYLRLVLYFPLPKYRCFAGSLKQISCEDEIYEVFQYTLVRNVQFFSLKKVFWWMFWCMTAKQPAKNKALQAPKNGGKLGANHTYFCGFWLSSANSNIIRETSKTSIWKNNYLFSMWQSWDKRLTKLFKHIFLSTMNNIFQSRGDWV